MKRYLHENWGRLLSKLGDGLLGIVCLYEMGITPAEATRFQGSLCRQYGQSPPDHHKSLADAKATSQSEL